MTDSAVMGSDTTWRRDMQRSWLNYSLGCRTERARIILKSFRFGTGSFSKRDSCNDNNNNNMFYCLEK